MWVIHQLFPLLVRSQRAVVAGDPQQIEPIINMSDDTIKQYLKTAFLDRGMGNEDYYRYAPTAKYTATAYHRVAGASATESDLGNGIILSNHYRCTPPIIQFCSPNYPGGLQILSDHNEEPTVKHLLAYHVEGSHFNHTNPEEIDAVETAIASALHNGAMKSSEKQCSVQNVARLIPVKMGSRKVNKITFARSADGSFLVPILRLLDTRMSLSVSA